MPKKLAEVTADLADVQKRATKFIEQLVKKNTNFWSHFGEICEGMSALADEVQAKADADARGAAITIGVMRDPTLTAMTRELDTLRRIARKESDEAYVLIDRLKAIQREVDGLKAKVDTIVSDKENSMKKSSSVDELKKVSRALNRLSGDIAALVLEAPHPSSHDLLN